MTTQRSSKSSSGKLLGDAGEHYALSQFSFAGKFAAKMPDNWEAYDLAVETGHGLVRASVKTRSESKGWKNGSWFTFDDRKECDWLVLIFKQDTSLRSWVIPFDVALKNANAPGPLRKDPWMRDISWAKLNKAPLCQFENNWSLGRNDKSERFITRPVPSKDDGSKTFYERSIERLTDELRDKDHEASISLNFPSEELIASFEGGTVHTSERGGEFLLIINQVALLDVLDTEDQEGIEAVKVLTFPSAASRHDYILERGWSRSAL